jgi:hypothetical protein
MNKPPLELGSNVQSPWGNVDALEMCFILAIDSTTDSCDEIACLPIASTYTECWELKLRISPEI